MHRSEFESLDDVMDYLQGSFMVDIPEGTPENEITEIHETLFVCAICGRWYDNGEMSFEQDEDGEDICQHCVD